MIERQGFTIVEGAGNDRRAISSALPIPRTSLVGRDAALANLDAFLRDATVRLVTLTGPGGIGKTRLAIEAACRMERERGVGFVPLVDLRDAGLVPVTILRALGLEALPTQSPLEVLCESLAKSDLLLVVDNLEHLPDAALALGELLTRAPGVTVLATSRVPLGLAGEQVFPVEPLSLPPVATRPRAAEVLESGAARLFVERARSALPAFSLTDANAADIAYICARLDGLPLAIELAAARSGLDAPRALAKRLRRSLAALDGGPRDAAPRQRTIRATVTWSVDLLAPAERELWVWMGVWEGGFTLEAMESLVARIAGPRDVAAVIDSLLRHGLLRSTANGLGEPRFAMLETTRELAVEHLDRDARVAEVRDAHAALIAEFCAQAEPGLHGHDAGPWIQRVEGELANVRAALRWDLEQRNVTRAAASAGHLAWFWSDPPHISEGRSWCEAILAAADSGVPARSRATIHDTLSMLADWQGDGVVVRDHAERALALWRELGDDDWAAGAMYLLGSSNYGDNNLDEAARWFEEGHTLARARNHPWLNGGFAVQRGNIARDRGELEDAVRFQEAGLRAWRAAGYVYFESRALEALGLTWLHLEDDRKAVEYLTAAIDLHFNLDPDADRDIAASLLYTGLLIAHTSQAVDATRLIASALHTHQRLGVPLRVGLQRRVDALLHDLESTLGAARYARAWNEGASLDRKEGLTLAREVLERHLEHGAMLSRRELEVLALMIQGVSDAEIAGRLFISPRTASKHVAAILGKLGAPNRTAAVTIAHRRGLV